MSRYLENLPSMISERLENADYRNKVASIASGILFFLGWWFAIDASVSYPSKDDMKDIFHISGVFATISMFMVNSVSNGQIGGESYTAGCMGTQGAKIWFFFGFLMGFGSLIGGSWILFGEYLIPSNAANPFHPSTTYPGFAIFIQNLFIFFASIIYKFGRTEDQWS